MLTITRKHIIELIRNRKTDGQVFSVDFFKKDGTLRTMNCRLGVTKHLKGGQMAYNPAKKGLLPVYDMNKQGYRMINLETIQSVKIGGAQYRVID